jgi:hypothetical protein
MFSRVTEELNKNITEILRNTVVLPLSKMIVRNLLLVISCPELFNLPSANLAEGGSIISTLVSSGKLPIVLVQRLLDLCVEEETEENSKAIFAPVVNLYLSKISNRGLDLSNQCVSELNTLVSLISGKGKGIISKVIILRK